MGGSIVTCFTNGGNEFREKPPQLFGDDILEQLNIFEREIETLKGKKISRDNLKSK